MINLKTMQSINQTFLELNLLNRWSSFTNEDKYNELAKQALNCITTYIVGKYMEKEHQKVIMWENIPKVAIFRCFQKTKVYFELTGEMIEKLGDICKIDKTTLDAAALKAIENATDKKFAHFIKKGVYSKGCKTYEAQMYRSASRIASFIEFDENRSRFNDVDGMQYYNILQNLLQDITTGEYYEVYEETNIMDFLEQCSKLRNQKRWKIQATPIKCSILGHLFDTAVFAYLMSLEMEPENEEKATNMFFLGLFHDIAEIWTTDIPSNIKDLVPGFREATEKFELKVIEENLYKKGPKYFSEAMRNVMMEEKANAEYKPFIKGADYMSADSEIWRQFVSGTKDPDFCRVMNGRMKKVNSGEVVMTPIGEELHKYIKNYVYAIMKYFI